MIDITDIDEAKASDLILHIVRSAGFSNFSIIWDSARYAFKMYVFIDDIPSVVTYGGYEMFSFSMKTTLYASCLHAILDFASDGHSVFAYHVDEGLYKNLVNPYDTVESIQIRCDLA